MKKAIYWFRNNLRIKDNPSLKRVFEENDEVSCIYIKNYNIYNPNKLKLGSMGVYRKKFLDETILDLKANLKKENQTLYILEGDLIEIFNEIKIKYGSEIIYGTREVGWYEQSNEKNLEKNNFKLILSDDQNLINEEDLPYQINELPLIFTHFRKKVEKFSKIRDVVRNVNFKKQSINYNFSMESTIEIDKVENHKFSNFPFLGGESYGEERLNDYLWGSHGISRYKETRNGLIGTEYSSKFSSYLALGSLSPVKIYHEIKKYEENVTKNESTYWLIFELLWREFFRYVYKKGGKKIFLKNGINGNIFKKNFHSNLEKFEKWSTGKTGEDFIDANMKELIQTGFMSNRGRQNVASYLVNNLDINWVWGAAFFEKHLIDYDTTSNWCNWMYISGVGNNVKNWIFNPNRQAEMYDKDGKYREIWLQKKIGQQNILF